MGRASGRKNTPRNPQLFGDTPEARDIGESPLQDPAGSPIPGLTGNIVNYETVRQRPATVQPNESFDEYRGMMAHGVPNDSETTNQRALHEQGPLLADQRTEVKLHQAQVRPAPIPVYQVEPEGGPRVFRSASPRALTVTAYDKDAVRVAGWNPRRNRIGFLNEDGTTAIRVAKRITDLSGITSTNSHFGSLLPANTTSYIWLETQDELFAVNVTSGTSVTLSIIEEFEQEL